VLNKANRRTSMWTSTMSPRIVERVVPTPDRNPQILARGDRGATRRRGRRRSGWRSPCMRGKL
jgi:hypothetical protein